MKKGNIVSSKTEQNLGFITGPLVPSLPLNNSSTFGGQNSAAMSHLHPSRNRAQSFHPRFIRERVTLKNVRMIQDDPRLFVLFEGI